MDKVSILGARGSVPRAGSPFSKYGGNTTCVLVELADELILLDAGSGMMELPSSLELGKDHAALLLTHVHVDHLLGLPLCPLMMDPDFRMDIYVKQRNSLDSETQLNLLISPPLWPVRISQLPAGTVMHELPERLQIGSVSVETMEGIHPDGVTVFKLSAEGHSVVFASDCTLTDAIFSLLTEFARDCDLLLCDGQYSDEEWDSHCSFGHSTWRRAAALGCACGAKKVRIIHHDPAHTDDMLDAAAPQLAVLHPDCSFALAQEEILL